MIKFTFIDTDVQAPDDTIPTVKMEIHEGTFWSDQAAMFFKFLLAQGFIVSEKSLSDYYLAQAKEYGNLRANNLKK